MPEPSINQTGRLRFKSPLAALALFFALGILWTRGGRGGPPLPSALLLAAICIFVGLFLLRARWDRTAVCLVLASMTLTGRAAMLRWEQRFPPSHVRYLESLGMDLTAPVILTGTIVSTPAPATQGSQFDLEVHRVSSGSRPFVVQGKVRLYLRGYGPRVDASGSRAPIQFGDTVRAIARLYPPRTYQNPGTFNFREWMEEIEDVSWIGTVRSARQIEVLGHADGHRVAAGVERARQRLLRAIDEIYPPWSREGRNGAVLKAVLWGDRTALDSDTIEDFRKTGLYHLLVIAGLHIGLITLLIDLLLRWIGLGRVKRAIVTLSFLAVYSALVDQRAPTLRATLMIALYLLTRILGRGNSQLNSLGAVALILLFTRPAWLFESGFQLSFSAALLIVGVAVPILQRTTEPYRHALRQIDQVLLDDYFPPRLAQVRLELRVIVRWLRGRFGIMARFPALASGVVMMPLRLALWILNVLIFSTILQLGLFLPMTEIFHRVTFAGVGLNALAIPVMTVLLAIALPINLLAVVSPALAAWPAKLLSLVIELLFSMAHLPRLAPWLSYRVPAPPLWVECGFCAAFVLAGIVLRYARRWTRAALVICAIFVAVVALNPFPPHGPQGQFELTALDCGQGEAIFVVLPGGATFLINAGGRRAWASDDSASRARRWNAGEEIVSPYLWSRGIKQIDAVALTQPSRENLEGLQAVIENFKVGEIWYSGEADRSGYGMLLDRAIRQGISARRLMVGDRMSLGGASITANASSSRDLNPTLAIEITEGRHRLLLPEFGIAEAGNMPIEPASTLEDRAKFKTLGRIDFNPIAFASRLSGPRVVILTSASSDPGASGARKAAPLGEDPNSGARIFRTYSEGATSVVWNGDSMEVHTYRNSGEAVIVSGDKPISSFTGPLGKRGIVPIFSLAKESILSSSASR